MPPFNLPGLLRVIAVWLLIMALESAQGALRRLMAGDDPPVWLHQLGVVIGVLLIIAVTWTCLDWIRVRTPAAALAVGTIWVTLTLVFELGLGRILGREWTGILADYDLSRGGLMALGLLAMALTPWAVLRLRRTRAG